MLKSLDEEERLRVVDGDKNDDKVIKLEIVRSGFLSFEILQEQVWRYLCKESKGGKLKIISQHMTWISFEEKFYRNIFISLLILLGI